MPESAGSVINIGAGKHTKRQLGQFCYADDCTYPLPAYKQVVSIFLFLGGVQWGTRVLPTLGQDASALQPWRPVQFSYAYQKLFCLLCFNLPACSPFLSQTRFREKVQTYPAVGGFPGTVLPALL